MYYFKIGVSAIFVIGFFVSLAYTLYLSLKVATQSIERKEAMRRSFSISFLAFTSIFIIYLIWQDISNWDFRTWIMVILFTFGISTFGASIFALALWNWKK